MRTACSTQRPSKMASSNASVSCCGCRRRWSSSTTLETARFEDLDPDRVVVRSYGHPYDGCELRITERRRYRSKGRLYVRAVLPDGRRIQLPADWTSLEARDADTPRSRGTLAGFARLRELVDILQRRHGLDGSQARVAVVRTGTAGEGSKLAADSETSAQAAGARAGTTDAAGRDQGDRR